MINDRLLIIFTRNPVLGKIKTRLAREIGDKMALDIYNKLLLHTHRVSKSAGCNKVVYYSDKIDFNDIFENDVFSKAVQAGDGLGERMENAFFEAFSNNYHKVVIIGSDIFGLTTNIINSAFEALENNDFVIGPAKDGGYYLLGMRRMHKDVFRNKNWSTEIVFKQTIASFGNSGYFVLPVLSDLDTLDDVEHLTDLNSLYKETIQKQK